MLSIPMVVAGVVVSVRPPERRGSPQARPEMAMGAAVRVAVDTVAVPVSASVFSRRGLPIHGIKLAQRSRLQCAARAGA
jgi:hypothetical protein